MDLGTLRTLARDICVDVLGVPITVTRPEDGAVPYTSRGVWYSSLDEPQPYGVDFKRRSPRRVLAIPLDSTLTDLPRGTTVLAAEQGQSERTWRIEECLRAEADRLLVVLMPT